MDFPNFLLTVTIIVVALVVVVLVFHLLGIILSLYRAGNHLKKLAGGLQVIVDNTVPLEQHVTTINGALGQLNEGLESVDNHLVGTAKVFNL
jgi:hypothetical protein